MVSRSNHWKKSQSARATWASLSRSQAERPKRLDHTEESTDESDADALPSRIRVREFLSSLLPEEPQPESDRFEVERRPRVSWRVFRRR